MFYKRIGYESNNHSIKRVLFDLNHQSFFIFSARNWGGDYHMLLSQLLWNCRDILPTLTFRRCRHIAINSFPDFYR